MNKLLKVEYRTLNNWKNGARTELYNLLSSLDYENAKKLLTIGDKESYVRVLENEKYFDSQLDFCSSRFIRTVCRSDSDSFKVEIF